MGKVQSVHGALDAGGAAPEDVGVDLGGRDVRVAEQLLVGADVGAVLEQVGGEGVAKGVAGRAFGEVRGKHSFVRCLLGHGLVELIAAEFAGLAVEVVTGGAQERLPGPFLGRCCELAHEGAWPLDEAGRLGQIAVVLPADALERHAPFRARERRQGGDAVRAGLAPLDRVVLDRDGGEEE